MSSFWENNKGTFKTVGISTVKGIGKGTKAIGKAGYKTYKDSEAKRKGLPPQEAPAETGNLEPGSSEPPIASSLPARPIDTEQLKTLPAPPKRNVPISDVPRNGSQPQYSAYRPAATSQHSSGTLSQQQQYNANQVPGNAQFHSSSGDSFQQTSAVGVQQPTSAQSYIPPPPPPRNSENTGYPNNGRDLPPPPYGVPGSDSVNAESISNAVSSAPQPQNFYTPTPQNATVSNYTPNTGNGPDGSDISHTTPQQNKPALASVVQLPPPPIYKNRGSANQSPLNTSDSPSMNHSSTATNRQVASPTFQTNLMDFDSSKVAPPPPLYRGPQDLKPTASVPGNRIQKQERGDSEMPPPFPHRPASTPSPVPRTSSSASNPEPPKLPGRPPSNIIKQPPPKPKRKPNTVTGSIHSNENENDVSNIHDRDSDSISSSDVSGSNSIKENSISKFSTPSSSGIADITKELKSKAKFSDNIKSFNAVPTLQNSSVSKPSTLPKIDSVVIPNEEIPSVVRHPAVGKSKPELKPKPGLKPKPQLKPKPELKPKPDIKPKPEIKPKNELNSKSDSRPETPSTNSQVSSNIVSTPPPPPPPARNYRRPKAAPPPPSLDLELQSGWFKDLNSSRFPKVLEGVIRKSSYQSSSSGSGYSTTTTHKRTDSLVLPDLTIVQYEITWTNDDTSSAKAELVKHVPSPLTNKKPTEAELISYHEKFGNYIAAWCEHHIGEKVGTGECYDLAQFALKKGCGNHAFVSTYYIHGYPILVVRNDGSGVQFSGKKDIVRRGDILQYESCAFFNAETNKTSTAGNPHHTSVVLGRDGSKITIAEQNVNNVKTVVISEIILSDLTRGTLTCFRAVPDDWLPSFNSI